MVHLTFGERELWEFTWAMKHTFCIELDQEQHGGFLCTTGSIRGGVQRATLESCADSYELLQLLPRTCGDKLTLHCIFLIVIVGAYLLWASIQVSKGAQRYSHR